MGVAAFAVLLLYRRITVIGRLAAFLWIGVIGTTLWIIVSGRHAFQRGAGVHVSARARGPVAGVLHRPRRGAADRGVRLLGLLQRLLSRRGDPRSRPRHPARDPAVDRAASPRIYLTMNISILGAMPWQEVEKSSFIASDFMAAHLGSAGGAPSSRS